MLRHGLQDHPGNPRRATGILFGNLIAIQAMRSLTDWFRAEGLIEARFLSFPTGTFWGHLSDMPTIRPNGQRTSISSGRPYTRYGSHS